jgi:phage gp46-like protein
MPKDFKIDPAIGDFVRDGEGGWVLVETAETAVQLQLATRYKSWWRDPEKGSQLGDIRLLAGSNKVQAAQAEAQRALRVLEQAGRIAQVQVIAEQSQPGRIAVQATFRDTSTGQQVKTKKQPLGG